MTRTKRPADEEGTIHFAYTLAPPSTPPLDGADLAALRGWRAVLRRLDLLGQARGRYGGLGFGNMSVRAPDRPEQFAITASQTGGMADIGPDDLVRILRASVERFWVDAEGRQPPSSESLTHAMIYAADRSVRWVLHVHSPEIWSRCEALGLPATPAAAPYGSPAMADAVAALLHAHPERPCVFATLGHEDGIFACGATAERAGGALLAVLAQALA